MILQSSQYWNQEVTYIGVNLSDSVQYDSGLNKWLALMDVLSTQYAGLLWSHLFLDYHTQNTAKISTHAIIFKNLVKEKNHNKDI